MLTILFIAFGLSMDAFAVSVTSGFTIKKLKVGHALKIAFSFGLFQAIMPIVGWAAGLGFRAFISGIDHWAAFGLLSIIGTKMIFESMKMDGDENKTDPLNIYTLLMLSVATSIDALAVGLSLSFLNIPILTPALMIGLVTFIFSYAGVYIGERFGHFFEKKIEAIGGLILIAIGIKILIEHMI
jgi:putative Mn2+ efflux pump MntP